MKKGNMIPANEFCASHNIEITFINTLSGGRINRSYHY